MKRVTLLAVAMLMSLNLLNSSHICILEEGIGLPSSVLKEERSEWEIFVDALVSVESGGDCNAVGTKNDVGAFQITPIYLAEANRLAGCDKYTLDDRRDYEKSREMFDLVQSHYNPERDVHKAIRLHNPGAGVEYEQAILNKMDEIKQDEL